MTDLDVIQRDVKYMRGELADMKQDLRNIYARLEHGNLTKTYATNEKVDNLQTQVSKIEGNQRYVVYTIIGAIIIGLLNLLNLSA